MTAASVCRSCNSNRSNPFDISKKKARTISRIDTHQHESLTPTIVIIGRDDNLRRVRGLGSHSEVSPAFGRWQVFRRLVGSDASNHICVTEGKLGKSGAVNTYMIHE